MACNQNRLNCSPDQIFAATALTECSRFVDPSVLQADQFIYDSAFKDIINGFGIKVDYYINTFNLSAANTLYGEHPTSIFYGPVEIMMYVELTENAISLSKFGFNSDDELTGYVHIRTFEEAMTGRDFFIQTSTGELLQYEDYITYVQTQSAENVLTELFSNIVTENSETGGFDLIGGQWDLYNRYIDNGQVIEPKSGDLVQLSPLGCDRPNGRGAKIFEITERTDQDIASLNPLLGHYIYRLKAKRYEYSFEPGAPKEPQNQQVFENSFSGILSSNIPGVTPSEEKSYPGDIDEESKEVFDMSVNDTDIYGGYY
jgi:hypothetical protein